MKKRQKRCREAGSQPTAPPPCRQEQPPTLPISPSIIREIASAYDHLESLPSEEREAALMWWARRFGRRTRLEKLSRDQALFVLFDLAYTHDLSPLEMTSDIEGNLMLGEATPVAALEDAPLPPRALRQLSQAAPQEQEKALSVKDAALIQQAELRAAEKREGTITVQVAPCGSGKSQAALEVVAGWEILEHEGGQAPYKGKTSLLGPTHKWAQEMLDRATSHGISAARFFSPPGEGGIRDLAGNLVCKKPRIAVSGHFAAGWPGWQICHRCPYSEECPSKEGREGKEDSYLLISPQQSPKIEGVERVIVDEWPALVQQNKAELSGLKALARGGESLGIGPKSLSTLARAAAAVVDWLASGAPPEVDPLVDYRETLASLYQEKNGKLGRNVDHNPHERNEVQPDLIEAWASATWLLRAAAAGAKLYRTTKGEAAWDGPTPIAKALREARAAVILTATRGDTAELEKQTGKKVQVVQLRVEGTALRELYWLYTASANRRGYFDNGRIRLKRKHVREGKEARSEAAPLASDLRFLPEWLRDRPFVRSLFLATFKALAVGLRLAYATHKGQTPDREDLRFWRGSEGQRAAAVLSQLQELLAPFFALLDKRGITLTIAHYGAILGLDGFKDANGFVSLGDPYPSLPEHLRRHFNARDLPEDEADPEWQAAYHAAAAGQLEQVHGRDRWPTRTAPVWHLHIGAILPGGWPEDNTSDRNTVLVIDRRSNGRPRRKEPEAGWQEVVAAAVKKAGSARALAKATGISRQSLDRYTSGKGTPTPETLESLRKYIEIQGGPETPIANSPS